MQSLITNSSPFWLLPLTQQQQALREIRSSLSAEQYKRLQELVLERHYRWHLHAREKQLEPEGDWLTWLILAGRGFGKSRSGAEWVRAQVKAERCGRLALIGEDAADVRDVMVKGQSGIMAISPKHERPRYVASARALIWPNGAQAILFSASDPESLRGPQFDGGWVDELAKYQYAEETWSNYQMALRLGTNPRSVVTTTPKPTPLIRKLIAKEGKSVYVTRGTTYENLANLSPTFREQMAEYEGTRLGRQELNAEVLDDVEGALWTSVMIEAARLDPKLVKIADMERLVVAVDPAVTAVKSSNETGIVVCGRAMCACKVRAGKAQKPEMHGFVWGDYSDIYSPAGWATEVVRLYEEFRADAVIAETNQGGDLVERNIRQEGQNVSYKGVHASRGKVARAEPISQLYEQGRVHHVGLLPKLEDQLTRWIPGEPSPDRLDAAVWGLTELFPTRRKIRGAAA